MQKDHLKKGLESRTPSQAKCRIEPRDSTSCMSALPTVVKSQASPIHKVMTSVPVFKKLFHVSA